MPPEADTLDAPASVVTGMARRMIVGIISVTLLLLLATAGVISEAALGGFEREVLPAMTREARAIGTSIAAQIERAVTLGVPTDELVGLQPFMQSTLDAYPALDAIRFDRPGGTVEVRRMAARADTQSIVIPVASDRQKIGSLRVEVNVSRIERSAADSRWDVAIVLMVALLTTVEVLVFLSDRYVSTPLRQVEQAARRLADGNWATRSRSIGVDGAGRFLSALNALTRRMNERWRHLQWLAAEVLRRAPENRAAVQAAMARLDGVRFAEGPPVLEPRLRSAGAARAPLFLYLFAEQLSTSFIPLYARSLYNVSGVVPEALAVGLPIAAFAGMIAVASPFGAGFVQRYGARAVLAIGCVPAVLGYVMVAVSTSLEAFIAWRIVTAFGYALITIACQAYLVAVSDGGRRGRSMAVFVYAAMTGAVCGTAIGAVLADRLGFGVTFLISAVLTAAAGGLALHVMDDTAGRRPPLPRGQAGRIALALRDPSFVALVVFATMPAKLVLTGFIFYLTPLFLSELQSTQPEIGRQMMLYSATMLVTIRAGAWSSDHLGAASSSIAVAGIATGIGLLAALFVPPLVAIPLAIAVTGLAQGLSSAPMLAAVPELCPELAEEVGLATLYGYVRFAERLGSVAGPVVAAVLVATMGFTMGIAMIGVLSLVATVAYWIITLRAGRA